MKIIEYRDNKISYAKSLLQVLHQENHEAPVISVVGAGGKSTIVECLAMEYQDRSKAAIVTTTTHMYMPKKWETLYDNSEEKLRQQLNCNQVLWVGNPSGDNKMKSVDNAFMKKLLQCHVPVIIEADGAKEMPCKMPDVHEPVILRETSLVLGIIGIDCIGKPIYAACHRPQLMQDFLGCGREHKLNTEDISRLILSEIGLRKHVKPSMEFKVLLNKTDGESQLKKAIYIKEKLSSIGFHDILFTTNR